MRIAKFNDMTNGWFVGGFIPTAYNTSDFEVGYLTHKKDSKWPAHYHKEATEINLLVKGKMTVNGKTLNKGDIFVIYPDEVSSPKFIEDCEIVCVKIPSVPGDKYEYIKKSE